MSENKLDKKFPSLIEYISRHSQGVTLEGISSHLKSSISNLREVFIWAYKCSCSLYTATKQSLGNPDPFRMTYDREISITIQKIVNDTMDKKKPFLSSDIEHFAKIKI